MSNDAASFIVSISSPVNGMVDLLPWANEAAFSSQINWTGPRVLDLWTWRGRYCRAAIRDIYGTKTMGYSPIYSAPSIDRIQHGIVVALKAIDSD